MQNSIDRWLALMDGPGWQGREARDHAVAEMRAVGVDVVFPLLTAKLAHPESQVRGNAVVALLFLDKKRAMEPVLGMLNDVEVAVRWHVIGCLHDFGDERAIEPLTEILANDPDPQMRGTAAYALGGVGSPAAIPALLRALDYDHEFDMLGHSASSCAATALDDILGTNETRIRVSETLCRLPKGEPNLDSLRRRATEVYELWRSGRQ